MIIKVFFKDWSFRTFKGRKHLFSSLPLNGGPIRNIRFITNDGLIEPLKNFEVVNPDLLKQWPFNLFT